MRALDRAIASSAGVEVGSLSLERGLVLSAMGSAEAATASLEAAIDAAPDDLALRSRAERGLMELGRYRAAERHAAETCRRIPRAFQSRWVVFEARRRLGRYRELAAVEDALVGEDSVSDRRDRADVLASVAAFRRSVREFDRAVALQALAVEADPLSFERRMDWARLLVERGTNPERTVRAIEALALRAPMAERAGLGDLLARMGAVDEARAVLGDDRSADALELLAELALWSRRYSEARERGQSLREAGHAVAAGRVLGAVALLTGDAELAVDELEAVVAKAPRSSAGHVWLGEALRHVGRRDEAVAALDVGIELRTEYDLAANINRVLATDRGWRASRDAYVDLLPVAMPFVDRLAGDGDPSPLLSPELIRKTMERILRLFAGNRSTRLTVEEGGVVRPHPVSPDCRTAARLEQERLRVRSTDEVREALGGLVDIYGEQPTIYCHRGEVSLWAGDYQRAAADFERALALDSRTRWAYIGLGAAQLMLDRLDLAERTFERALVAAPPPGRTLFVYRGELHRRRGRPLAAAADLRHAIELNPDRISAHLNLGLLLEREAPAEAAASFERVAAQAPGLADDAAAVAGTTRDARWAQVALEMMRGNRSTGFVTYVMPSGVMRFVPPSSLR